jgi:hypothetical protein
MRHERGGTNGAARPAKRPARISQYNRGTGLKIDDWDSNVAHRRARSINHIKRDL